ncbi:hypothetical protein D8B46_00370 [Candidatus Gracilibacteria bacterium]|nr:MAG: hypothetical protein D8B46_00370 [Candidatus Gracilibacteria bacterium]
MKIGLISLSDNGNFLNHDSYKEGLNFLDENNINYEDFIIESDKKEKILENFYKIIELDVDLVWFVTGGNKLINILGFLDWEKIKKSGKKFIGFSDFTHFAYVANLYGIECYYGPGLKNILKFYPSIENREFLCSFLKNGELKEINYKILFGNIESSKSFFEKKQIIGGHLNIFIFLHSFYKVSLKNKFLFLEFHPSSFGENKENLEYYLEQLVFILEKTELPKGFILGHSILEGTDENKINKIFLKKLKNFNLPIIYVNHFYNIIKF